MRSGTFFTGVVWLAAWFGLAACAGPNQPSANTPTTSDAIPSPTPTPLTATGSVSGAEEYRIGPQDLLELQVFGADALNRTVRVNSLGFISLPLIGHVRAAGLTSDQLEKTLAAKLAQDYLQNPQVSVFIKEFTSQRVTVEGAVQKPGVYPLKGRTTLLQALATAEGLTSLADAEGIKVFRADPITGTRAILEFDLEKIRSGEVRDPEVRNDDIVQVRESRGKTVAKELIDFILPFRYISPTLY